MTHPLFFEPKNSLNLFGLNKDFKFLSSLYNQNKLPKVLMLTGEKGSGKSTLVNHFLYSIFDSKNYNNSNFTLIKKSNFYNQFKNNIFSNIIYIDGSDFKSTKVDNIRDLKNKIFQSAILKKDRFCIFDNIELFNLNSLNALLKIIEEPNNNDYFILINNNSRFLIDTIKSRSIELKIILNSKQKKEITHQIFDYLNIVPVLNIADSNLSPGNNIKFNFIFDEYKISTLNDFVENISFLLNLYRKSKDVLFVDIAFFIVDLYLRDLREKKLFKNEKIYDTKNFIFTHLNKFLLYNINLNTLTNALNTKIKYE